MTREGQCAHRDCISMKECKRKRSNLRRRRRRRRRREYTPYTRDIYTLPRHVCFVFSSLLCRCIGTGNPMTSPPLWSPSATDAPLYYSIKFAARAETKEKKMRRRAARARVLTCTRVNNR